jgi:CarD family transcriptional regulator
MGESMFVLNEKVVYPGYGVAIINRLVERLVVNKKTNFFELKFYNKDMTVLIPEDRLESIGVRKLSSVQELSGMFDFLYAFGVQDIITEHNASTWNKRNKEYQSKLRSGQLLHIASIYKELQLIGLDKDLSFGEKNLFHQIESLLIEEICAVDDHKVIEDIKIQLRAPFLAMEKQLAVHTHTKLHGMAHKELLDIHTNTAKTQALL